MEKIFENFTVTILKLNKLVHRIKNYESQKYGLKAIHIMCGYYLKENPDGLTSSELVKLTLEDKAAISRALKLMQQKGYITYDSNTHNAPVKLTDSGRQLADFITERSDKAVEAGSVFHSEEEREHFYVNLAAIAKNLSSYYGGLCREIEENNNN